MHAHLNYFQVLPIAPGHKKFFFLLSTGVKGVKVVVGMINKLFRILKHTLSFCIFLLLVSFQLSLKQCKLKSDFHSQVPTKFCTFLMAFMPLRWWGYKTEAQYSSLGKTAVWYIWGRIWPRAQGLVELSVNQAKMFGFPAGLYNVRSLTKPPNLILANISVYTVGTFSFATSNSKFRPTFQDADVLNRYATSSGGLVSQNCCLQLSTTTSH